MSGPHSVYFGSAAKVVICRWDFAVDCQRHRCLLKLRRKGLLRRSASTKGATTVLAVDQTKAGKMLSHAWLHVVQAESLQRKNPSTRIATRRGSECELELEMSSRTPGLPAGYSAVCLGERHEL